MSNSNLYNRLGGEESISKIVDTFYEKMTDDYRVSRFFNDDDKKTQRSCLKALVNAILNNHNTHSPEFKNLLTKFFMSAFARFKDKERLPETVLLIWDISLDKIILVQNICAIVTVIC